MVECSQSSRPKALGGRRGALGAAIGDTDILLVLSPAFGYYSSSPLLPYSTPALLEPFYFQGA